MFKFIYSFVQDTSKYVNTTVNEVDNFAIHNLDELMLYFNTTLDEAGNSTKVLVDDTLVAINFTEIENITHFIYDVSDAFVNKDKDKSILLLNLLNGDVANITTNLEGVIDGLNRIHDDNNCIVDCQNIVDGLTDSITNIKTSLDDFETIDNAINSINQLDVNLTQIDQMVELINGAEETLTNFSDKFVNDFTQGITHDIANITDDIKAQVTNLTEELRKIDLDNATIGIRDNIENFANYTDIILYATLVPAIILGVALLFSCFGLIFGKFQILTPFLKSLIHFNITRNFGLLTFFLISFLYRLFRIDWWQSKRSWIVLSLWLKLNYPNIWIFSLDYYNVIVPYRRNVR